MKDFLKYTMASVVGIILASVIFSVISLISVAGMIASEGASGVVPENSVLRIKLQGELVERAGEGSPMDILSQGEETSIGLDQALEALKKAADNENVKGIYLEGGLLAAEPAMLQELRQGLQAFKESGKWIVAYGDSYSKTAYYLASVADSILLNPEGVVEFNGMATELMFYKDVMDKLGIKMQVFKVGTYKSAVEPFIASEMSPANREQVTSYLTSIWNNMVKEVAESRHMDATRLNTLADT